MLFSFDLVNEFFQNRVTLRMLEFLCRQPLTVILNQYQFKNWIAFDFFLLLESKCLNNQNQHALRDTTEKADILNNKQNEELTNNPMHADLNNVRNLPNYMTDGSATSFGQGGAVADTSGSLGTLFMMSVLFLSFKRIC